MQDREYSCTDCYIEACGAKEGEKGAYPDFCLTKNLDEDRLAQVMETLHEEDNYRLSKAAAEVEAEHYGEYCRVQEVMCLAKKLGIKKLGIATCIGLLSESRKLAEILRANGFEVYSVCCKCGAQKKSDHGIIVQNEKLGPNMCNPILQAGLLNDQGTGLNIVMGLCVGHDSLFFKYSKAPATSLVCKDRLLGNNPVQALYLADSYYHDRLFPSDEEGGPGQKKS